MDDSKKHFYIKFKIDKRIDKMTGFLISEEKATVDAWTAEKADAEEEDSPADSGGLASFEGIAKQFPKSIEVFRRTVPFIMRLLPLMRQFRDDDLIRKFIKEHGRCLDADEFETYQVDVDYLGELNRRLENAVAIASGVKTLPSMFLVGLISAYDAFLAQTIRAMFLAQPGLLSSSERTISLKDLMELNSIEVAREKIIEKEVETIIRESHADQIKWLETKLGIPLRKDLKIWPAFIEVCERRNLFTHTGGVISSQYIDVCKTHGCDVADMVVGNVVSMDEDYYRVAVTIVLELGSKLVQVIWRKLLPDEIQTADETLNRFAYDLLVKRMYSFAAVMLRFGLFEMKKHGSEAVRRQMVINYANAEKLNGNKELALTILDGEDWSASTDLYKLCVAAVKDDLDTVIGLMKSVVDARLITLSAIREWPVFETIRPQARFIDAFERAFGQKLLADKQVTNLDLLQAAGEPNGEPDAIEREGGNIERKAHSAIH